VDSSENIINTRIETVTRPSSDQHNTSNGIYNEGFVAASPNANRRSLRRSSSREFPSPTPDTPQQPSGHDPVDTPHDEVVELPPELLNRCKVCAQEHRSSENHEYDYVEEGDEELQCEICLQPFISPYDTSCGHTFCERCLKNHVRAMKCCPLDRKPLTLNASDIWASSRVLYKLVDKLEVICPNYQMCQFKCKRSLLQQHLVEKCPRTVVRCEKSIFGCQYKCMRVNMKLHENICPYKHITGKPIELLYPSYEPVTVEIFRKDPALGLGLYVVGGQDTPLRHVHVQDVLYESVCWKDGRIKSGDILYEVNGECMHNVTHVDARLILHNAHQQKLIKIKLLRYKHQHNTEKYQVKLDKPPGTQLGIKITAREDLVGVYILELVKGRVNPQVSRNLRVGDRILKINNCDVTNSSPDRAAMLISEAVNKVELVISRSINQMFYEEISNYDVIKQPSNMLKRSKSEIRRPAPPVPANRRSNQTNQRSPNSQLTNGRPSNLQPANIPNAASVANRLADMNLVEKEHLVTQKIKTTTVHKRVEECLGIVIAGGYNNDSSCCPIYIRDILHDSVFNHSSGIQRGEVIVRVNRISLIGRSHNDAVQLLKEIAFTCDKVTFVTCSIDYHNKKEETDLWEKNFVGLSADNDDVTQQTRSVYKHASSPSWKTWVYLPLRLHTKRTMTVNKRHAAQPIGIVLVKSAVLSLDGERGGRQQQKVFIIKSIIEGSPAHKQLQGLMWVGDILWAVNNQLLGDMSVARVTKLLRDSHVISYNITTVTCPGSLH